jgi:hypothetical protein
VVLWRTIAVVAVLGSWFAGCGGGTTTIINKSSAPKGPATCGVQWAGTSAEVRAPEGVSCNEIDQVVSDMQNGAVVGQRERVGNWNCAVQPAADFPLLGDCYGAQGSFVVRGSGSLPSSTGPASSPAPTAQRCPVFTGPGDNLVHSRDFSVQGPSCDLGHQILLTCKTGSSCQVGGSEWTCANVGNYPPLGYMERCRAGDQTVAITWLD